MRKAKPVVLCILDGWGVRNSHVGNAVALAKTPAFDDIMAKNPSSTLITYGSAVGLPVGQMGNSEVGHMNIGAGRVVQTGLRKIETVIEQGNLGKLDGIVKFISKLKASGGAAHLCGILSDGGVHSHIDHMMEMARVVSDAGIKVLLHLFSDGRDVAPKSALKYLKILDTIIDDNIKIATISGRYYALDRDNRWDRVALAYNAIMHGKGENSLNVNDIIHSHYKENITDEFIIPTILDDFTGIKDIDGLLFLNFRADRAREILAAIGDPEFKEFETGIRPKLAILSGFVKYSERHNDYMDVVFPSEKIVNTLGEWIAKKGLSQLRIAETEKYPHVTFFLNGGVEVPNMNEDRYLAPSPKVATYDLAPEMSCKEICEHLVDGINSNEYDLIIVNFANPDMVGHTGNLSAAILACESVDRALVLILKALRKQNGAMIVCADHGNCETMIDPETGDPHTAHTTNPVPVAVIGAPINACLRSGGCLADLAPTLLMLMGIEPPSEMTGKSLLI